MDLEGVRRGASKPRIVLGWEVQGSRAGGLASIVLPSPLSLRRSDRERPFLRVNASGVGSFPLSSMETHVARRPSQWVIENFDFD